MNKSLLFIPDISGFTEFVQTTEANHSQHVIAELLEVLVEANTQDLVLAEVEGDALFFYKEELVSAEKLLAQIETIYTAFYSHLKLLEKNRICPCNACSSAPKLQLKIIVHCGDIEFITVQNKRKPFGKTVIEAHRLLKNSVESDNYVLLSKALTDELGIDATYKSKLFHFDKGSNSYDGKSIAYLFSEIQKKNLKLKPFAQAKKVHFERKPDITIEKTFPIEAKQLLEYITNYALRPKWTEGVDDFKFNENEVTRVGSEHICVINGKHLNFTTVIKEVAPEQLVYGEHTTSPKVLDELHQFFVITPLDSKSCRLESQIYITNRSLLKKIVSLIMVKKVFRTNTEKAINKLRDFVVSQNNHSFRA